jgi:fucose permease
VAAPAPGGAGGTIGDPHAPGPPRLVRVLAPAAAALALYVGVETLLSGWSAVLTHDLLDADPALAALGASAFWLLMSAGRAWGARTHGGVTGRALVAAALFALAAVAGRVPPAVVAACAVTVLVVAPAYPRLLGAALDRLDGPAAARWTGPLVAAGAAGGSLLPALVLRLGPPSGPGTFVSAAVACLLLAVVARVLARGPGAVRPELSGSSGAPTMSRPPLRSRPGR